MANIGITGLSMALTASNSFKGIPFTIKQFADAQAPLDVPNIDQGTGTMCINGRFVSWQTANAIPVTINLSPGTQEAKNMLLLAQLNRIQDGKNVAGDVITLAVTYPTGEKAVFTNGVITSAPPFTPATGEGRQGNLTFSFLFGGVTPDFGF